MEINSEEHQSVNSSEDLHMIDVDDMVVVSVQPGTNKQKDKEVANDKGNEKNTDNTDGKATKRKGKEIEK
ncbi:hypothetical protein SLEP1_g2945 [Rubroshorea leprosula]|uniref:Uncharacterized protein n=1 Tax=Rubroshorea leprosula TaxID=152421 RepID=A0AAV5HTD6_9ROSI|nr:hypothetical protein SLEP1_g2945 [Rubroshorea leprosula]